MDSSKWFALVRYMLEDTVENVCVSKIKVVRKHPVTGKSTKAPFTPLHLKDFDKNAYYAVTTNYRMEDGVEKSFYAHIGKLAETEKGLQEGRRVTWPPERNLEMTYPASTTEEDSDLPSPAFSQQKAIRNEKSANQQKASNAAFINFLGNRQLVPDSPILQNASKEPTCSNSSSAQGLNRNEAAATSVLNRSDSSASDSPSSETPKDRSVHDLTNKLRQYEERIKQLELEREESKKAQDEALQRVREAEAKAAENCDIHTQLSKLETTVGAMQNDLKSVMDKLDTVCMQSTSSVTSASASSSQVQDIQVPIGGEFTCSKWALDSMLTSNGNHPDWANALLRGVFKNDAPYMRVKVRQPKGGESLCKKFPPNFLTVAKVLHRDWLQGQTMEVNGEKVPRYSPEAIQTYVDKLPGYLGDRALSLMGSMLGRPQQKKTSGGAGPSGTAAPAGPSGTAAPAGRSGSSSYADQGDVTRQRGEAADTDSGDEMPEDLLDIEDRENKENETSRADEDAPTPRKRAKRKYCKRGVLVPTQIILRPTSPSSVRDLGQQPLPNTSSPNQAQVRGSPASQLQAPVPTPPTLPCASGPQPGVLTPLQPCPASAYLQTPPSKEFMDGVAELAPLHGPLQQAARVLNGSWSYS